jgi:hypothetical protein
MGVGISSALSMEAASQVSTATKLTIEGVTGRFGVVAETCTTALPDSKAEWNTTIADVRKRVADTASAALATDTFATLRKDPIPQEATDEILSHLASIREDFQRSLQTLNANTDCPRLLANLQKADAELLKVLVTQFLAELQTSLVAHKKGTLP